MRHFSGEFEGMRLLMADELDLISGGEGEDTDDIPPAPDEIVVNGIRQDEMDQSEKLMERQWLLNPLYLNQWVNVERDINGDWLIWAAQHPTEDQIAFKGNYNQIHSSLWGHLSETQQSALASSLLDRGVNLVSQNINIGYAYLNYGSLLSNGSVHGNTTNDFADWVAQGGR